MSRLPARSVLLHTPYAEVSTGDPHPATTRESNLFCAKFSERHRGRSLQIVGANCVRPKADSREGWFFYMLFFTQQD